MTQSPVSAGRAPQDLSIDAIIEQARGERARVLKALAVSAFHYAARAVQGGRAAPLEA